MKAKILQKKEDNKPSEIKKSNEFNSIIFMTNFFPPC